MVTGQNNSKLSSIVAFQNRFAAGTSSPVSPTHTNTPMVRSQSNEDPGDLNSGRLLKSTKSSRAKQRVMLDKIEVMAKEVAAMNIKNDDLEFVQSDLFAE